MFGSGGKREVARVATAFCLIGSFLLPASLAARASVSPELRLIGTMPFGANFTQAPEMLVDSTLHLGYAQAFIGEELQLVVYDLRRMRVLKVLRSPRTLAFSGAALDERHHRVFFAPEGPFAFSCDGGAVSELLILDELTFTWTAKRVPCRGTEEFMIRSLSYHDPTGTLYAFGAGSREQLSESFRPDNKQMIVRALNPDTLEVLWEIDPGSQCDNGDNRPYPELITRVGSWLFSYCYRNGSSGALGLSTRTALNAAGAPVIPEGAASYFATEPTLPQRVAPFVDPVSGRMILFTAGPPNGQAAWVFDPVKGRFFGAIPSGAPNPPQASLFLGFDARAGRLYILNARGIVVADIRHSPLPSGVSYPVLDNVRDNNSGLFIAVDTTLRRLFVPVLGKGFRVVEDRVPQPPKREPPDPDEGTADIPEVTGKTDTATSSGASAFGVHLLNTGGIPRSIDTYDPLCNDVSGGLNDKDESGRCPADRVLTPGNREYFLSDAHVETGSGSGVGALAAAGRSPSTDSATDADFRSVGRCLQDKLPEGAPAPCSTDTPVVKDFQNGTHGADGQGFPVTSAQCNDFEGKRAEEHPKTQGFGSSDAICDAGKRYGFAAGRSAGFAYPSVEDPIVTVGRSWSSVESAMTSRGLETSVESNVTGVRIGDLTIGRITTKAQTRARGRTGTTYSFFERTFKDVEGPALSCVTCDPAAVVAAINQALGPTVRARLPEPSTLASPRGFQALVVKDPALAESDRTINDDDTQTVNGLDVIIYNDGKNGRSRLVIGLAGVQAESRYGIFPLTEGGGPTDTTRVLPGRIIAPPLVIAPPVRRVIVPPPPATRSAVVVSNAFRFIRLRPREAGLMFMLWALFATPVYLAVRRRALGRGLSA